MRKTWKGLLVALLVCAVSPLFAGTFTFGGALNPTAAPASVATGVLESNTLVQAFGEKRDLALGAPVTVDLSTYGTYTMLTPGTPLTLPTGRVVNSYYFHFDPATGTGELPILSGWVNIQWERILGVVILDSKLTASNGLGFASTTYPSLPAGFGLDNATRNDSLTFGYNAATHSSNFSFTLQPASWADADNIRIITDNIPEPATGLLLLPGLLALGLLRRRVRASR